MTTGMVGSPVGRLRRSGSRRGPGAEAWHGGDANGWSPPAAPGAPPAVCRCPAPPCGRCGALRSVRRRGREQDDDDGGGDDERHAALLVKVDGGLVVGWDPGRAGDPTPVISAGKGHVRAAAGPARCSVGRGRPEQGDDDDGDDHDGHVSTLGERVDGGWGRRALRTRREARRPRDRDAAVSPARGRSPHRISSVGRGGPQKEDRSGDEKRHPELLWLRVDGGASEWFSHKRAEKV